MIEVLSASSHHAEIIATIHAAAVSEPWTCETHAALLEKSNVSALLATDAGVPVGFVLVQQAAAEAEILMIATLPLAQRKGIAKTLIISITKQIKKEGAEALFLEVAEDNAPARRLYEGAGFVPVGRRKGYYPCEGGTVDALLLRLDLVEA